MTYSTEKYDSAPLGLTAIYPMLKRGLLVQRDVFLHGIGLAVCKK